MNRNKVAVHSTLKGVRLAPCRALTAASARAAALCRIHGQRADVSRLVVCALGAARDGASRCEVVSACPPLVACAPRAPALPPALATAPGDRASLAVGWSGGWHGALRGRAKTFAGSKVCTGPGCARKRDRFRPRSAPGAGAPCWVDRWYSYSGGASGWVLRSPARAGLTPYSLGGAPEPGVCAQT